MMKYTCEVWIDLPRDEVITLFDNTDNLFLWQQGLKSIDIISGTLGVGGLKSKLVYDRKGKEIVMVETVETFDFPGKMIAIYEAKNVWNKCVNIYEEYDGKTLWQIESEFIASGLNRVMMLLGKSILMKQTLEDMNRFKIFAEK